jgi:NTP pyrophosphatase (non-canonical NTP hydrolase)
LEQSFDYIKRTVPHHEVLAQLAEECAELGQAALKLRRTLNTDASPTNTTKQEANEHFREEVADVLLTLTIALDDNITITANGDIIHIMAQKCDRWAKRLVDAGRVKHHGCNPDYCELE